MAWDDNDEEDDLRPEEKEIPERFTRDDYATFPCPHCKEPVSELADVCPSCHMNILPTRRGVPPWIFITGLVVLVLIILVLLPRLLR